MFKINKEVLKVSANGEREDEWISMKPSIEHQSRNNKRNHNPPWPKKKFLYLRMQYYETRKKRNKEEIKEKAE